MITIENITENGSNVNKFKRKGQGDGGASPVSYPKQHHRVLFSDPEYVQETIKDDMKTIKEIREKAGLISCSRNTLSAAENGKSVLTARLLHAVSEKL